MSETFPIRFGKYQLLNRIALGGMAELSRARITSAEGFEKFVAIKTILPHLTDEEDLVNSFIDEAKLAAMLQHQNIVQIYDFGRLEDMYFIAMEHLFGKDLRVITNKSIEKKQPLSLEYMLYIVSKICEGLDYAHNLKDRDGEPLRIIHRDISPPNILITYEGEVKIVDFGIAKAASHNTQTAEGVIKGKVCYMSPEQARGTAIDQRSDIFSAGILLYELVTGVRMYDGDGLKILTQVRQGKFKSPKRVIKNLPPRIYEILSRALAKDPEKRYLSSGEMLSELEECIYQNGFRPNARGLARYMKELFEQDIAEEEQVLREATQICFQGLSGSKNDRMNREEGKTNLFTRKLQKMDTKQLSWYGVLAAAVLVAIGGVLALSFKDKAVSTPLKVVSTSEQQNQVPGPSSSETGLKTMGSQQKKKPRPKAPSSPVTRVEKGSGASRGSKKPGPMESGLAALKQKHFAKAVSVFDSLMSRHPGMAQEISGPYEQALLGQAGILAKKYPRKAKPLLLKVIKLNPDSEKGHKELGHIYVRQKNYLKAIESFKKVAQLNPKFPGNFFNLAYVYAKTNDYRKAEAMYGRVVKLAPSYLDEALFNLAFVQDKQGKRSQCIKNLERALAYNPKNSSAKEYLRRVKKRSGKDS